MISLSLFKVNFDELNIDFLSKRPILDSLKIFYRADEIEYLSFLEELGIDYYKKFNNIFELNKELNKEIKIFNDIASKGEMDKFDFRATNLFKRNLKEINDSEYVKINFDLRGLNDSKTLSAIKDIFIITDSVSLVDFKEIEDERVSLIYHRKGASTYDDELILNTSRECLNLLENFKVARQNNYILTRFLLEISKKFKEAGIDESFSYTYQIGETKREVVKDIDEIIFWGTLDKETKERIREQEEEKQELANEAKELAKNELKQEKSKLRNSLKKDSTNEILENEKSIPNIYNLKFQEIKSEIPPKTQEENESRIKKIVQNSFIIYREKEIEKANIRLEKAQKDSFEAYKDLKNCLNDGLSILDAIKNIQQKYRNEDTVNFATLLFAEDILNIGVKDERIKALENELKEKEKGEDKLLEELTKKEENISKLKGTIQLKINEMKQIEASFEEENKILQEELQGKALKLEKLEKYSQEQDESIVDLNSENQELTENRTKLENEINFLKNEILSHKQKVSDLTGKIKAKEEIFENQNREFYKLQALNEIFDEKEKSYKETIKELKEKNEKLENKIGNILENMMQKSKQDDILENEEKKHKKRSRDILGEP